MTATRFDITSRSKPYVMFYAQPADFGRGEGTPVSPSLVLDEPGWSPYCVDPDTREIIYAHVPSLDRLLTSPFYHTAQYEQADAMLTMSFDDALALAADLPPPKTILIFSMGRCGTTLVSHALNGPPNVASFSEPGVFQHRPWRALETSDPAAIAPLLNSLNRLLLAAHKAPGVDTVALKFMSQALFVGEHFWNAIPDGSYVFMYRDAIGWGNSFLQFVQDVGIPLPMDESSRAMHWMMNSADQPIEAMGRYIDLGELPANNARMFAPGWMIHMLKYLDLRALGIPFLALRYNELVKDREGELKRLFDHCGLSHDAIAEALTAFDEDSQKGTAIARKDNKQTFTPEEVVVYRETLARVPAVADPNLILPDIYT
jgi:hypothetical protein